MTVTRLLRPCFASSLALLTVSILVAQDVAREPIALWPQGAPGSEDRMKEPENVDRDKGRCNVYKSVDVPCELHIYFNAGHGFGYRPGTDNAAGDWPMRLREWLRDSHLLGG